MHFIVLYAYVCVLAAFDQGIQVSYSKEDETVTLAFPEELKVFFCFFSKIYWYNLKVHCSICRILDLVAHLF